MPWAMPAGRPGSSAQNEWYSSQQIQHWSGAGSADCQFIDVPGMIRIFEAASSYQDSHQLIYKISHSSYKYLGISNKVPGTRCAPQQWAGNMEFTSQFRVGCREIGSAQHTNTQQRQGIKYRMGKQNRMKRHRRSPQGWGKARNIPHWKGSDQIDQFQLHCPDISSLYKVSLRSCEQEAAPGSKVLEDKRWWSLVVQWLRPPAPNAGGPGLILESGN